MKWMLIDAVFLFGLPALRIPWLEWSTTVMLFLYMAHVLLDGMLMFRIGVSWTLSSVWKVADPHKDTHHDLDWWNVQTGL